MLPIGRTSDGNSIYLKFGTFTRSDGGGGEMFNLNWHWYKNESELWTAILWNVSVPISIHQVLTFFVVAHMKYFM